ncbi:MAG TPA: F0F1 ATP synthase subunit A [bacterium]|nr:F0F1 ATP synthase subunit A [bacterium]HPQ19431.1 F0F1 ATP synthase subunit A [bacterium]
MTLKKKILYFLILVTIVQIIIAIIRPDKIQIGDVSKVEKVFIFSNDKIKEIHQTNPHIIKFLQINIRTVVISWLIILFWFWVAFKVKKNLSEIPSRLQSLIELIIEFFRNMVFDTLGKKKGKIFFPLIMAIFLFVWTSNIIGVIPSFWQISYKKVNEKVFEINKNNEIEERERETIKWLGFLPEWFELAEPTQDINTTLGLGIMVFFIVVGASIYYKGLWNYLKEFAEPIFILLPLNIVGEISKVISHSFRLFGNIKGGGIILAVVFYLVGYVTLPAVLPLYFGLFAGTVQAFVFSSLALVYLAVQIVDDNDLKED